MLSFELTKDTPYLALSGELWSVFYEYFNRNWLCYKGFLLYHDYKVVHKIHVINELFYVRIISQQIWQPELGYLLMQQIFLSQQMGVGGGVLVVTINQVCGSFYLSNATTGDVWIIPSFRIWGYVLHAEHFSSWIVANISESSLLFSQYRFRPCWGVVCKHFPNR